MLLPGEPGGGGAMVGWLRRLRNFVRSLEIKPGVGYMVHRGADGTRLEIRTRGGGGASVSRYRVESVGGDYVIAHTWDGSTEGTEGVYLAKPYKLRHSITAATVDGVPVTYSYSTVASNLDKKRLATNGTITEEQYVTPRWLTDDELFAINASTGVEYLETVGTDVSTLTCSLLDINADARAWAVE